MLQRRGGYPAPPGEPQDIPGLELAGEVAALGPGASRFAEGDRVMAVVGGGGQAELAVVHERQAMPVPEGVDWPQAGGLPGGVHHRARRSLHPGRASVRASTCWCTARAGGVGTAAVQIARAAGARVTATVRREELRDEVGRLGARVIAPEGFGEHGPYDVILELVGAANLEENLGALALRGRIAVIGVGGSGPVSDINLLTLMQKRARIHGSVLRPRPLEEKAIAARLVESEVLPHFESGAITVPVAETFPLDRVEAAYDRFAAGGKLGKIVLVN